VEKIGVESIFITKEFDQGIRDYNESLKTAGTHTQGFAREVEAELKKVEEAAKKAARAYSKDYVEGLNRGSMGTKDFQSQLMASAETMGLSTKEISRMAGASGLYTEQQLKAAEASRNVAKKADELTKAVASGKMTAQEAGKQFAAYAKTQEVVAAKTSKSVDQLGKLKQVVKDVAIAMGIATAAVMFVKGIKSIADETVKYADQVRDLSRALGTNAEQSSTLIQVADDLFVSYDVLKIAMKKAQVEGINPNIEGLMELAKKYQSIPDPAERSAFAIKMFGKAGMEMTKILEKTPEQLKAMGDALEGSNLIMSQESVDAAYKYKQAMDELGDTWQGLKYQVGSALIPALTAATKGFTTHAAATLGLWTALHEGKITLGEYLKQSAKVTWSSYDAADAQVWLNGKLVEARDAQNELNRTNMDARDRIAELNPVLDAEAQAMEDLEQATNDAKIATDQFNQNMSDLNTFMNGPLGKSTDDFKTKMDDLNTKLGENQARRELLTTLPVLTDEQRTELGELQTEYGEISAAITKTADDHELATKRMLLDLLIQRAGLVDMTAEGQTAFFNMTTSIAENWGLIDEETAIATRGIDKAMQGFASGAGTQAALNTFYSLVAQAKMLEGTHEILFNIRTTGEMPTIHGGQIDYRAVGGPAVGGSSYVVGEKGPELFVPEKSGQVISNRDMKENYSVGYSTRGDQVIVLPKATANKTSVTYSPAMAAQPVANSYSNAATVNMGGVNIYNGMGEGELAAAIRRVMRSEMAGV
jgi:hypothetical protein